LNPIEIPEAADHSDGKVLVEVEMACVGPKSGQENAPRQMTAAELEPTDLWQFLKKV